MKFNCPNCQIEIEADADVGDIGDCPNCGRSFRVSAPGVLVLTEPPRKTISVPRHEPAGPRIRVPSRSSAPPSASPATQSVAASSLVYEGSGMASSVLLWLLNPFYGIIAVAIAGISSAYASVGDKERAVVFARAGRPVRLIGWILTIIFLVIFALVLLNGCVAANENARRQAIYDEEMRRIDAIAREADREYKRSMERIAEMESERRGY